MPEAKRVGVAVAGLTHGTGAIVGEALDELDNGDRPCGPWDRACHSGESRPLFLGRKGSEEVGRLILDRV